MATTAHRMNHIFAEDRKSFIMALDHGANFNVLPALKDAGKMIREIAKAGADAFLATVGMADKLGDDFLGRGIILRVDGGVSHLGDRKSPMRTVVSSEDALRMGADALITMGFPGSVHESDVLSSLSKIVQDAHRWHLPVVAEMLPYGFEKVEGSRSPENLTFACRQGAELGADIIKTEYTGDPESFAELTGSCYVPVVILGGAKKVPECQLLTEIREALDSGAAGIAMGRNIWGHETPWRYAAAIARLIHEDATVEQALSELNAKF